MGLDFITTTTTGISSTKIGMSINRNWSLTRNNGGYKEPDPGSISNLQCSNTASQGHQSPSWLGRLLLICWFLSSRLPLGKWLLTALFMIFSPRTWLPNVLLLSSAVEKRKSVNFLSSTKICCGLGTKYIPIFQPKHLGLMLGPEGPTVLHGFYPWFYPSSPILLGPNHWEPLGNFARICIYGCNSWKYIFMVLTKY